MSTKIRELQARKAAQVKAARDFVDATEAKAQAENRGWSAEETAQFEQLQAAVDATSAAIVREQALAAQEAGLAAPTTTPESRGPPAGAAAAGSAVVLPAAARLSVAENIDSDPQRGFSSIGDFARAVHGAWRVNKQGVGQQDARLAALMPGGGPQAGAPTTYSGEGTGADGGFLIPPGFSTEVFMLSLGEDSLLPLCDDMPIEGNGMSIPKDETTPWGTNGIRAYWQAEANAATATKPVLGMMDLRLKKLLALTPVSDELLSDATALAAYLPKKMALSLRWKTNESILFGGGNGTPTGAFTGLNNSQGCGVVQAKDSGQATNTLSTTNLLNMFSRLPPGSYSRAIWMINNSVIPALGSLTLGNYPIFLPISSPASGGAVQPALQWTLLGRPVVISQHAKAFSSQGDVLLLDLEYYQTITKAEGVQTATSMHLYFDADAMAFRTTFRMDGQPKLVAPITPANGSTTLSPFVQLASR
jgi:HK97 family phage major capsid protein